MRSVKLVMISFVALVAVAAQPTCAAAQSYPIRPIIIIVPFPAGGGSDGLARLLADHMKGSLGQPVVIENVTGTGGSTGVARAARAQADGHTISFGQWTSHVGAGAIYPVKYDVLRDFEPVARLGDNPLWIVTRTTLPAGNFKEMLVCQSAFKFDPIPQLRGSKLHAELHLKPSPLCPQERPKSGPC